MLVYRYWGLRENPFSNVFTPRFFYQSLQHKEALERMTFVATNPELYLGLLTGEVGTGKTLISRLLEVKLKNKCLVLYLANGFTDVAQVVRGISVLMMQRLLKKKMSIAKIESLLKKAKDNKEIFYIFLQCLERYVKHFKKNLTIIVDECHRIDRDALIALKGVTNYLVEFKPAVSVILTGQKDITHTINTTHELKSRLSVVYSLKGFELNDTYKYIMHRVVAAGAKVPIFSREAIIAIHEHTGGRPREINKIGMLALQHGALNKSKRITAELILRIFADQYGML
jgi:type II secretory pathway predicted ATPase ExeA